MSENRFGDKEQEEEQEEEDSMPPPSPRRSRNRNSRNPFRCSSTAATFLATSFAVAALFLVFSFGPPSSGGHGQRVPANMSEFRFDVADIPSNGGKRFTAPPGFTFAEAMGRMAEEGDNEFTKAFTKILKSATPDQSAYFFETPGQTLDSSQRDTFEFVLNDASRVLGSVSPEEGAFAEYFSKGCGEKKDITVFDNLSGDARLVSPCPSRSPLHSNSPFAHLAAFSRGASQGQVRRFWRVVAKETMERLRRHPGRTTWLSTSGAGVYWLHARLDSRPKYYTYREYARRNGQT